MWGRLNISQVVFWQHSQGKRTHADLHRMKECAGCAQNDNRRWCGELMRRAALCLSPDQDMTASFVFSSL